MLVLRPRQELALILWEQQKPHHGQTVCCTANRPAHFLAQANAIIWQLLRSRIRPHLRPWIALTLLAVRLMPTIARNPRLAWRAFRAS